MIIPEKIVNYLKYKKVIFRYPDHRQIWITVMHSTYKIGSLEYTTYNTEQYTTCNTHIINVEEFINHYAQYID